MKTMRSLKKFMAALMSVAIIGQAMPGQVLSELWRSDAIVAHAEDIDPANNERQLYEYIKSKGFNNAAACGILASMYLEPETASFNCSYSKLKEQFDKYMLTLNLDKDATSSTNAFIGALIGGKTSYISKLRSLPETREGAYAAGMNFCDFLNQYFHDYSCPLPQEYAGLAANGFWKIYEPVEWLVWPTVPAEITTKFGWSEWHAQNGYYANHTSIDIGAWMGAPVKAIASGTVVFSDYFGNCGNRIVIRHSNGIYSAYNHLNTRNVFVGDDVFQSALIGTVGNSGAGSGAHLDFQILDTNNPWHLINGQMVEAYGKNDFTVYSNYNQNPLEWMNLQNDKLKSVPKMFLGTYVDTLSDPSSVYNTGWNNSNQGGQIFYPVGTYEITGVTSYLNVRSDATINSSCVGKKFNGDIVEITDVRNNAWGYIADINGWISLGYATYIRPLDIIIKPDTPVLNLSTSSNIALNKISTVSWNAVDGADTYTVRVYDSDGNEVKVIDGIKDTSASFTLDSPGSYTVKAVAVNKKYTSDTATLSQKINVHPDSTVIFIDDDGSELSKQIVPYGDDATVPDSPTKKGFTFNGWSGNYRGVKNDITITATYQRNKYNVTFYDADGSTLDSQRVYYENSAAEPVIPTKEGYIFKGWDKKFDYIEDNIDIYPVFAWEKEDLPIIINNLSAVRDSEGYNVSYTLKSTNTESTPCRLVISLKTSEGKLITYTESNAYYLKEDSDISDTIYVPSQEVASVVEINAVSSFLAVIPISENKISKVEGSAFTNWSTQQPPDDALEVEKKTEYRYRTKTYKESDVKLPSPWVFESETTGYTEYGPWSEFSETYVASSDLREVQDKDFPTPKQVAQMLVSYCTRDNITKIRQYRNESIYGDFSSNGLDAGYDEHFHDFKVIYLDAMDSATIIPPGGKFEGEYWGYNRSNVDGYYCPFDTRYLWFKGEAIYENVNVKMYRYRDRSKKTIYTYSQLSEYSDWSDNVINASDDKVVETRTVYRYIPSSANMIENNNGEEYTISGNVDASFSGKQAILFVYKIDEAADYTNEAVAQTVIGSNGEYSFTFKLREEPTSVVGNNGKKPTGDFTVTLGIEGNSSVIFLDSIKAPVPEYDVEYVDFDGTSLLKTTVKEGETAIIPEEIPVRAGYTFIGWDYNPSNIHSNLVMTAQYSKNKYTVAFVNWNNHTTYLEDYYYGDTIIPHAVDNIEGYEFVDWDCFVNDNSVVTGNMVVTAIYKPRSCVVTFVDRNGETISEQEVVYGDAVELPDSLPNTDNSFFAGWDTTSNLNCIKASEVIHPLYQFYETTEIPMVSIESGEYSDAITVELSCEDDAVIKYTVDGDDPVVNGIVYNEALTLDKSCVLKCCAISENKNASDVVTKYYAINTGNAYTDYMDYNSLPEYVKKEASKYGVTSTTGYKYLQKISVDKKSVYDSLIAKGWNVESETWSEWSEWSAIKLNDTDAIIQENSKNSGPMELPFFQYSHWKYYDNETDTYCFTYEEIDGVEGEWEYIDCPEKLPVYNFEGSVSSYSYNAQIWYNQKNIVKEVVSNEKVYQYRYKTLIMTKPSDFVEVLPEGETAIETGEVYRYKEPSRFIVEIVSDDNNTIYRDLVIEGSTIELDQSILKRDGYEYLGLFDETGNSIDIESFTILNSTKIYAKYDAITYSITFMDNNGAEIVSYDVPIYSMVTPPSMPDNDDEVFVGWDNDNYMNVTADSMVTAKYVLRTELPSISIPKTKYYLYTGNRIILSAETKNIDKEYETIVWCSMNPDIIKVSDDGEVTAINAGVADVVVQEKTSGTMSLCTIQVSDEPTTEDPPQTTSPDASNPAETPTTTVPFDYSDEEICSMVLTDYEKSTGQTPKEAVIVSKEGTLLTIEVRDDEGNSLDTYTIDSQTGNGETKDGSIVELPQTGYPVSANNMLTIAIVLILAGMAIIAYSSIPKKRED